MHINLVPKYIQHIKDRHTQGDCPTIAPLTIVTMENLILTLEHQLNTAPSQTVEPMDIEGLKRELYNHFCPAFKKYDPHAYIKLSDVIDHLHVTNRLRIGNEWKPIDEYVQGHVNEEVLVLCDNRFCFVANMGPMSKEWETYDGNKWHKIKQKVVKYMRIPDTKAGGEK